MSFVLATASPPAPAISSTTCCAGPALEPEPSGAPPRSFTTTFAPSRAKSSACSRPIPLPAPVIAQTRPSSAPMFLAPLRDLGEAVLDDGDTVVGFGLVDECAGAGVPDPGGDRLPGLDRLREPHGQAAQAGRVVRARGLDHRARREG